MTRSASIAPKFKMDVTALLVIGSMLLFGVLGRGWHRKVDLFMLHAHSVTDQLLIDSIKIIVT